MARPTKQTVDYFPHYVSDSKTKFMLENRYGNDGYAFWFKLLELLCKSDGHYYDCKNIADWEYLLALTKVPEDTSIEILEKLSEMGKIDSHLWTRHKVIWCQSLVDNLVPVYSKRTVSLPKKPVYDEFSHRKPLDTGNIGVDNPQSIVEESKENESISPPISPNGGNENARKKSGESLMVETATGEPEKVSPSKTRTRKSRKKAKLTESQRASFDRFWELWPNKVSKGQAEITWAKIDPDEELFKAILNGVERAKKYDKRFLDGYMPHASTWLNAKGWLDEFNIQGGAANGTNKQINVQSGFKPSTGFRKKV